MWALYRCFHLCLGYLILYPEAIVTSCIHSVRYRAHGGAIVAVFYTGLSMTQGKGGHKTMGHCKEIAQQM